MQHLDQSTLVSSVARIVEELHGGTDESEARLRARIEPLVDAFLWRSRPIEETEATIVLVDIRGFTALTESHPPRVITDVLNAYFAAMVGVVERHGGLIDKFMGDAVMAVFGAPLACPDHPRRALACAVDMQLAMRDLNPDHEDRGLPHLYAGVAVSTGRVMAGSFGSPTYQEYTVIGDPVNLASRIEGYSLRGQVLLSPASHAAACDEIEIASVNEVMVKGKSEPLKLFELRAIRYPRRLEVPQIEVRRSPRITVDLPIAFRMLDAKRVSVERYLGKANDLGYHGMNADLPIVLPPRSELLISLTPDLCGGLSADVYARVLRSTPGPGIYRTNLEFTAIDTAGHRKVKQFVDQVIWGR